MGAAVYKANRQDKASGRGRGRPWLAGRGAQPGTYVRFALGSSAEHGRWSGSAFAYVSVSLSGLRFGFGLVFCLGDKHRGRPCFARGFSLRVSLGFS